MIVLYYMKIKEFGPQGGGGYVSLRPFGSANTLERTNISETGYPYQFQKSYLYLCTLLLEMKIKMCTIYTVLSICVQIFSTTLLISIWFINSAGIAS